MCWLQGYHIRHCARLWGLQGSRNPHSLRSYNEVRVTKLSKLSHVWMNIWKQCGLPRADSRRILPRSRWVCVRVRASSSLRERPRNSDARGDRELVEQWLGMLLVGSHKKCKGHGEELAWCIRRDELRPKSPILGQDKRCSPSAQSLMGSMPWNDTKFAFEKIAPVSLQSTDFQKSRWIHSIIQSWDVYGMVTRAMSQNTMVQENKMAPVLSE